MKFTDKNDFIVKNKNGAFLRRDYDLFLKHCPNSRLHSELKHANSFNKGILDGHMLFELLDKVSAEEILKNREIKPVESEERVIETLDTAEAVSDFLKKESPDVEYPASVLETLTGKTEGEILNFIEFGKLFIAQSEQLPAKEIPAAGENDREPEVKDAELSEKKSELESKEQELEEKESELEEKEGELTERETELEEKEAELEDKAAELETKEKEVEQKAEATKKAAEATTASKKKVSTKNSPK
jgi:hypothetical protein